MCECKTVTSVCTRMNNGDMNNTPVHASHLLSVLPMPRLPLYKCFGFSS